MLEWAMGHGMLAGHSVMICLIYLRNGLKGDDEPTIKRLRKQDKCYETNR
jgi:hypothetical protein